MPSMGRDDAKTAFLDLGDEEHIRKHVAEGLRHGDIFCFGHGEGYL
jgi:hypothetical protein